MTEATQDRLSQLTLGVTSGDLRFMALDKSQLPDELAGFESLREEDLDNLTFAKRSDGPDTVESLTEANRLNGYEIGSSSRKAARPSPRSRRGAAGGVDGRPPVRAPRGRTSVDRQGFRRSSEEERGRDGRDGPQEHRRRGAQAIGVPWLLRWPARPS